jgi:hypothetical protein
MTKREQLRQAIRKLIKEEVSSEINKAMGKILAEIMKEIKKDPQSVPLDVTKESVNNFVLKTNNPKLNAALAETVKNFKPLVKTLPSDSLVSLIDGGLEKVEKNETVNTRQSDVSTTNLGFIKQLVNESAPTTISSVLDDNSLIPESLKNVFKRDFRDVLKKSREKKNIGHFNPSVILSGDGETPTN